MPGRVYAILLALSTIAGSAQAAPNACSETYPAMPGPSDRRCEFTFEGNPVRVMGILADPEAQCCGIPGPFSLRAGLGSISVEVRTLNEPAQVIAHCSSARVTYRPVPPMPLPDLEADPRDAMNCQSEANVSIPLGTLLVCQASTNSEVGAFACSSGA